MLNRAEDNEARLVGIINSNLEYSHAVLGESFYKVCVRSERLSENEDEIAGSASCGPRFSEDGCTAADETCIR